MIEALIEDGVRFHFTRDHLIIDSSSPPQEKLRFYLGTILGKYYIDNLKTEINKGLEARRQVGLWNCKAPFGYKNIRTGSDKKAIVVQDEITAPLVKEIFQLYSTGNYPLMFFVDLIQKKAGRKVTKRVVEEMLNNPFYYGVMRVKNQLIPGVHEPLIEKKLWENCQKVRGIRAATHNTTRKGTIHKPFMGLLNCGVCGHQITGESKVKASGRTYIYYRCANQSCEEKRKVISQEKLLEQIVAAFEPFAKFTPKATRAFIDSLHQRMSELDLYTQKKTGELAEKRLQIKDW